MHDLARLGFVLLGAYLILGPLGMLGVFSPRDISEFASGLILFLSGWAMFGLTPGLFLLLRNRQLAKRLFPPTTETPPIQADALVSAGVAVLGVYLAASALAGFFMSLTYLANATSDHLIQIEIGQLARSAALAIVGLLLYLLAPRFGARFSRTREPSSRPDAG